MTRKSNMNNKIKWTGALFLLLNGSWVWAASLPADLTWETNDTDPVFASPRRCPAATSISSSTASR